MKFSTVLLATCLIAFTAAQWPCHDFGWNGPISNCASCTVGGTTQTNVWAGSASAFSVCTNCTAGFFLNQSACIPCTNNCTSCYSNGACTSSGCAPGFAYIKTNQTCMACPASFMCKTCTYQTLSNSYGYFASGPFACTSCLTNSYYITAAGACSACTVTGCSGLTTAVWSGSGACPGNVCVLSSGTAVCQTGYVALTATPTVCTACGTGCNTCSAAASATCTACAANGYYLSSGTCSACTVSNCLTCSSTAASTCDACASGYFLSANTCTACPTGCSTCSSATACTVCTTGYYLPVGAAPQLCTAATAQNTANCSALVTNSGFATTGTFGYCGSCVANSNTTYHPAGYCVSCTANCTSCALTSSTATTTVCLQCQLGFGLNDTTGACVPCGPNCDYCDGSGVCTQCRSGVLSGNVVQPATQSNAPGLPSTFTITQGFYLPPNQCQQCPYNCSACANSTFCFNNCTKNYMFNSTTNQCLPNGASRIVVAGFAFLGALFYFI